MGIITSLFSYFRSGAQRILLILAGKLVDERTESEWMDDQW